MKSSLSNSDLIALREGNFTDGVTPLLRITADLAACKERHDIFTMYRSCKSDEDLNDFWDYLAGRNDDD